MELVIFVFAVVAVTFVSFWILGSLYGLIRTPAVLFPMSLALKMTGAALLGFIVLGFGAIPAAMFVFHHEFSKRSDYHLLNGLLIGGVISTIVAIEMFFVMMAMAWQIFD